MFRTPSLFLVPYAGKSLEKPTRWLGRFSGIVVVGGINVWLSLVLIYPAFHLCLFLSPSPLSPREI
jgi:hypothetical protein